MTPEDLCKWGGAILFLGSMLSIVIITLTLLMRLFWQQWREITENDKDRG
jgi:hypothetical protein